MGKDTPIVQGRSAERRAKRRRKKARAKRCRVIAACLAVLTTVCVVVFAVKVIPHQLDLIKSKRELAGLRESAFDADMRLINPDYTGIVKIDGTNIDYHVVRGEDNVKYLNTTFRGDENKYGAIFMDYRCIGENVPHILIYGHQVNDTAGNWHMFGGLEKFLDAQYLAEYPNIMYIENDLVTEFEIFSARRTDITDPAYQLDFSAPGSFAAFAKRNGAPNDAEKIITLSTCIGADNDRRLIVQGVLRNVYQVEPEQREDGGWYIKVNKGV